MLYPQLSFSQIKISFKLGSALFFLFDLNWGLSLNLQKNISIIIQNKSGRRGRGKGDGYFLVENFPHFEENGGSILFGD